MKTEFEKRTKYSINSWLFGKPKPKYRLFYFLILIFIIIMGFIFQV